MNKNPDEGRLPPSRIKFLEEEEREKKEEGNKKEVVDVPLKKSADSSAKKQEEDMKNWIVWLIVAVLVIFIAVDKGCNKKMGNVNPTAAATVTETVIPVPESSTMIKNGGSSVEVDVKVKVSGISGKSAVVKSADVSEKPAVAKEVAPAPKAVSRQIITGNAIAVFNDYSSNLTEIWVYGKGGVIAKVPANETNVIHYRGDTLAVRIELHKDQCSPKILWEKKLTGGVCVIKCSDEGFVASNDQSILPLRKG
jgi:hypothetical protein